MEKTDQTGKNYTEKDKEKSQYNSKAPTAFANSYKNDENYQRQ